MKLPGHLAFRMSQGTLLTFGDGHPYCRRRYHVVRMWGAVPPAPYWTTL